VLTRSGSIRCGTSRGVHSLGHEYLEAARVDTATQQLLEADSSCWRLNGTMRFEVS
jgi:hypothetical protein